MQRPGIAFEEGAWRGTWHLFRRVQVITGEKDQGYVQITQMPDLPEGAEIVTEGAFYLISEMKKGEGGTTIKFKKGTGKLCVYKQTQSLTR